MISLHKKTINLALTGKLAMSGLYSNHVWFIMFCGNTYK